MMMMRSGRRLARCPIRRWRISLGETATPGAAMSDSPLRALPSVNAVLEAAPLPDLAAQYGQARLTAAVRAELADTRRLLRDSADAPPDAAALARRAAE